MVGNNIEDKVKHKQISVLHVVYGCIIALIIITCILTIAFGGNKDAGNQMNVMATGISVVLAVIAILMTLVDVAGQRQSIIDIKETAKKLAEYQEKSQESIKQLIEEFDKLQEIKSMMKMNTDEYKKFTEELISEKFKGEQNINEVKSKLDEEYTKLNNMFNKSSYIELKNNYHKKVINKFRHWIKDSFQECDKIDYNDLLEKAYNSFPMSEMSYILTYLRDSGATYAINESKVVDLKYIKGVPPQYF